MSEETNKAEEREIAYSGYCENCGAIMEWEDPGVLTCGECGEDMFWDDDEDWEQISPAPKHPPNHPAFDFIKEAERNSLPGVFGNQRNYEYDDNNSRTQAG